MTFLFGEKVKRILEYDGLRGWLLMVIACNHLFGAFVSQLTREPFGFVSAAEGFVFLSGFVAFLVYSKINDEGVRTSKIWWRSFTIYRFHLCALFLTVLLVYLFPLFEPVWKEFYLFGNWFSDPLSASLLAIFLLEQPGFFDILILYLLPMLFLPFAITALKKGQVYWLAASAFGVWVLAQFLSQNMLKGIIESHFTHIQFQVSYFDPLSWQWLFFLGVIVAYFRFEKGQQFHFKPAISIGLVSLAVGLMCLKHFNPEWLVNLGDDSALSALYGGNNNAPILRQLNLLLVAYVFMLVMRYFPLVFKLKLPVYLGQHALPVFAFHTVVVYFLMPAVHQHINLHWYWDVLACTFFILLLLLPAYLDELYLTWKRRKIKGSVSAK